jgi:hypothetical protein
VIQFDAAGNLVQVFDAPSVAGWIERLAWTPDGLWVVDIHGNWYLWSFDGQVLRSAKLSVGTFPYENVQLAFDEQGYLWLMLRGDRQIYQIALRQDALPTPTPTSPGPTPTRRKGGEQGLPKPQFTRATPIDKVTVHVINSLQGKMVLEFGSQSAVVEPGNTWSAELPEGVYSIFASTNVPEPIAFSGIELLLKGYEYTWVLSRPE